MNKVPMTVRGAQLLRDLRVSSVDAVLRCRGERDGAELTGLEAQRGRLESELERLRAETAAVRKSADEAAASLEAVPRGLELDAG